MKIVKFCTNKINYECQTSISKKGHETKENTTKAQPECVLDPLPVKVFLLSRGTETKRNKFEKGKIKAKSCKQKVFYIKAAAHQCSSQELFNVTVVLMLPKRYHFVSHWKYSIGKNKRWREKGVHFATQPRCALW